MTWHVTRRVFMLVAAAVGAALAAATPALAQIDYSSDLGAEFLATYPGGDPSQFPPSSATFGDWALRGPDGTSASLTAKSSLPASGQSGWDAEPSQGAPYTYFAAQWFPGVTIDPRVQGHARHDVLWTAPASVNAGGIEIRGSIEQLFENPDPAPGRIQRLSVFKNGAANPSFFVDSLQPVVDGVILNRVDFGPVLIPVVPGDTLRFLVDGSGAGGNGIVTFVAWNVQLHEAVPEPAAAGLAMASCVALLAAARRRR